MWISKLLFVWTISHVVCLGRNEELAIVRSINTELGAKIIDPFTYLHLVQSKSNDELSRIYGGDLSKRGGNYQQGEGSDKKNVEMAGKRFKRESAIAKASRSFKTNERSKRSSEEKPKSNIRCKLDEWAGTLCNICYDSSTNQKSKTCKPTPKTLESSLREYSGESSYEPASFEEFHRF